LLQSSILNNFFPSKANRNAVTQEDRLLDEKSESELVKRRAMGTVPLKQDLLHIIVDSWSCR
jgi:hypothetical protein